MTWIKTVPPAEAEAGLQEAYRRVYALYPAEYLAEVATVRRPDGTSDSVTASHSLLPRVMEHIFSAFGLLLAPELPLTRRQHEMIATLVSGLNRCFY
jgi:hypothetical protein